MNKTELVSAMAERLGASKKHSEEALTVALDLITEALAEGEKVQLVGFGSFEVRERAPPHRPQSPHQGGSDHPCVQSSTV